MSASDGVVWREGYKPLLPPGLTARIIRADGPVNAEMPRLLGIRIDKLGLSEDVGSHQDDRTVEIVLYNVGGKGTIGGCVVRYSAKRVGDAWTVRLVELFDP
jgi:hypothetical protein